MMIHRKNITGYEGRQKTPYSQNDTYEIHLLGSEVKEVTEKNNSYYSGILRYNRITNEIDSFTFNPAPHIISQSCVQNMLYYIHLIWNNRNVTCSIIKLNCNTTKISTTEVYSFVLSDLNCEDIKDSHLWGIQLFSISDRYICLAIPLENGSNIKDALFSHMSLIDLQEQKSYTIPKQIDQLDSVLRFNTFQIHEYNQLIYILVSTCKIDVFEKEAIWKLNIHKSPQTLQNLIVIEAEHFVQCIKQNLLIDPSFIIDRCLYTSGFAGIMGEENLIYSHKHHFADHSSEIVTYDIISNILVERPLDDRYQFIFAFEKGIYGLKNEENETYIVDITNNRKLLTYPSSALLLFFNHDFIITRENLDINHMSLTIYDKKTGEFCSNFILIDSFNTSVIFNPFSNTLIFLL